LQLTPDEGTEFMVRQMLPRIEILDGNYEEARRLIDEFETDEDYLGAARHAQVQLYAATGQVDSVRAWLAGDHWPWSEAIMAAAIGDKDLAFARLETLYYYGASVVDFVKMAPGLDALRDDPRYEDLLKRLGYSID
jgi:hypothetical protein